MVEELPGLIDYSKEPELFSQESFGIRNSLIRTWCQEGQYVPVLSLLNSAFSLDLSPDFILVTGGVHRDWLGLVERFKDNPHLLQTKRGSSAEHSFLVVSLVIDVFERLNKAGNLTQSEIGLRNHLVKMAICHEFGEAYGEISTYAERENGDSQIQGETFKAILGKISRDESDLASQIREKITMVGDKIISEKDRSDLEVLIAWHVLSRYGNEAISKEAVNLLRETESRSDLDLLHKILERMQTNQKLIFRGENLEKVDQIYLLKTVSYTGSLLQMFLESKVLAGTGRPEEIKTILMGIFKKDTESLRLKGISYLNFMNT